MSTREDYPAGVPCWVDTNQPDPADAARFYSGLFGWETEDAIPADAGGHYVMARIGGRDAAAISSMPPGAPPRASWNTYIRVESADDAAARVALPGYGDHLEELNPGMRAGMKEMGAPEGFEDIVARILPRDGAPARWSVTFAVDDVDATSARARELGGSILAQPQDAPWVRFAVLADPAGASFTASQFVAENR